jgi:hypothetical protein
MHYGSSIATFHDGAEHAQMCLRGARRPDHARCFEMSRQHVGADDMSQPFFSASADRCAASDLEQRHVDIRVFRQQPGTAIPAAAHESLFLPFSSFCLRESYQHHFCRLDLGRRSNGIDSSAASASYFLNSIEVVVRIVSAVLTRERRDPQKKIISSGGSNSNSGLRESICHIISRCESAP